MNCHLSKLQKRYIYIYIYIYVVKLRLIVSPPNITNFPKKLDF